MDWNTYCWRGGNVCDVALFTEGVDWNCDHDILYAIPATSPSSQRVWIEILPMKSASNLTAVALFTEGVDWNNRQTDGLEHEKMSPSSQRVWIEITLLLLLLLLFESSPSSQRVWIEIVEIIMQRNSKRVALFTEGVDWNMCTAIINSKSPRSPSSQRVWIEICWFRRSWIF